ncbi:MAG: recombination mediator RecR [Coprothermobacterota bacterium]|jgi:recombination protein RecR|nr:recombination mediator RecR [Caldisericota bacterium]MDI6869524.1 recombination mediator RecR [Coprothermobacterota bacterium]
MPYSSPSLTKLIEALRKLPGIGPKSAERIAFYILKSPPQESEALVSAIMEARWNVKACSICFFLADTDPCPICQDKARDQETICVVEDSRDVIAMERAGAYKGLYHVLGGALSPLDGIGPGDLRISELFERVRQGKIKEVILATNPTMTGDITAAHLAQQLKVMGVKVTRIAHGLPVGTELELADEVTLNLALQGRREM